MHTADRRPEGIEAVRKHCFYDITYATGKKSHRYFVLGPPRWAFAKRGRGRTWGLHGSWKIPVLQENGAPKWLDLDAIGVIDRIHSKTHDNVGRQGSCTFVREARPDETAFTYPSYDWRSGPFVPQTRVDEAYFHSVSYRTSAVREISLVATRADRPVRIYRVGAFGSWARNWSKPEDEQGPVDDYDLFLEAPDEICALNYRNPQRGSGHGSVRKTPAIITPEGLIRKWQLNEWLVELLDLSYEEQCVILRAVSGFQSHELLLASQSIKDGTWRQAARRRPSKVDIHIVPRTWSPELIRLRDTFSSSSDQSFFDSVEEDTVWPTF